MTKKEVKPEIKPEVEQVEKIEKIAEKPPLIEDSEPTLDKRDLLPEEKTDEDNSDYCDRCYSNGKKTKLERGQDRCSECGMKLDWG